MLNVSGSISETTEGEGINGPVDHWIETLATWATQIGIDTFILWPTIPDEQQVETWASDVVPQVRTEVARIRTETIA